MGFHPWTQFPHKDSKRTVSTGVQNMIIETVITYNCQVLWEQFHNRCISICFTSISCCTVKQNIWKYTMENISWKYTKNAINNQLAS